MAVLLLLNLDEFQGLLHRIGQPYPTPPPTPGPDLLSELAYDSKACGSSAPPGLAMAKRAADSRY
jgi:hypothetical protein